MAYDLSESMGLQASDRESWVAVVWNALDEYNELMPNDLEHEEERDDICTAMAWIREALGLPDEVELMKENDDE